MISTQLPLLLLIGFIARSWSFSPSCCASYSYHKTVSRLRHKGKRHNSQIQSQAGDGNDIISVSITKQFPNATPKQAKDAWIEYHYRKGGGLPIFIVTSDESPSERTILPTMMKETRIENYNTVDNQSFAEISYKVTDAGPLFPGIIPNSHTAKVTFERTNQVTVMKWDVSFETTKFYELYQAITQWTVGTAATTVEECLMLPRRLSVKTVIDEDIDPILARKECLDFVWANGGGLPLIPPIPFGDKLKEGGGSARRNLLRIPPLITESIIGTAQNEGQASFQYQLNSPGWTTFPFLLHTHIGSVSFTSTAQGLVIDWEVEFRPYQIMFAKSIIEKLVEMTVTTIVRNTRVKLVEPDAVVTIRPPRGNTELTMGFEEFGKVSKATWLGGVLESHLSDTRSTSEQVFSLMKPWTWGRSGTGDENDIVQYKWKDGQQLIENTNVASSRV